jgi:hypothetical protein
VKVPPSPDNPAYWCLFQIPQIKNEMIFLSVDAEAIDDKPVVDEYITPQAIAFRHLCLYGNPGPSPGAEECTGRIV